MNYKKITLLYDYEYVSSMNKINDAIFNFQWY